MIEITNRNYDIAAARAAGERLSSIADRYGLHVNSIGRIAQDNAIYVQRRGGRPLPSGLTARAAVKIEDVLGIWPTAADIPEVSDRWDSMLRWPVRKAVLAEIRGWVRASR